MAITREAAEVIMWDLYWGLYNRGYKPKTQVTNDDVKDQVLSALIGYCEPSPPRE